MVINRRSTVLMWRAGRKWRRLPHSRQAVLWALLACMLFSCMGLLVKLLGRRYDVMELTLFRAVFGLIPLLPALARGGRTTFRTARPLQHLLRGLFSVVGMCLGFYATSRLPLTISTAISFTTPLYMIFMAALVLHEKIRWRRWVATLVGFIGIMIVTRPFSGTIDPAALVGLAAAFVAACAVTQIKRLSTTEPSHTIVFYMSLVAATGSIIPAALAWRTPTALDFLMFLALGLVAGTAQVALTRAYAKGEATIVAPIDYCRLLFAIGLGFLVFGEWPDRYTLLGAAIIIASTLYITYRERQLGRLAATRTAAVV